MEWKKLGWTILVLCGIVFAWWFADGYAKEAEAADPETPVQTGPSKEYLLQQKAIGAKITVRVVLMGSPSATVTFRSVLKTDGPYVCSTTLSTGATTECRRTLIANYREGEHVMIKVMQAFTFKRDRAVMTEPIKIVDGLNFRDRRVPMTNGIELFVSIETGRPFKKNGERMP
jgi:hypothetical protein